MQYYISIYDYALWSTGDAVTASEESGVSSCELDKIIEGFLSPEYLNRSALALALRG